MESPESSSPIVTRAVAAGLQSQFIDNYSFPHWQKIVLDWLGRLPASFARAAIPPFQTLSALPQSVVSGLSIETLAANRLTDYNSLPLFGASPNGAQARAGDGGRFPAITLGVALGGTTAHLSLALNAPFLPQAFVVTLKGGSYEGDVRTYFNRSHALALEIAKRNPNVLTIQHYDPVHDNWLTRYVNHLRLKLLSLPEVYKQFIKDHLEPGGALVYFDCGADWQRFRVGERSVFQVGGWGGLTPDEFLEPSERVKQFVRAEGMQHYQWALDGYPLERGPESEWGSEPGLAEAIEAFCAQEGYRFVRIQLPHPNDFSRLAFHAYQHLLQKEGREPAGTLVECFTQFDATAVLQTGLLPLWLIFNTTDSLDFLRSMTPHFPRDKPVFVSPLITFSHTPDMVPFDEWFASLSGFDWVNIGARHTHYPADAWGLVHWADGLREWAKQKERAIRERLRAEELESLTPLIH